MPSPYPRLRAYLAAAALALPSLVLAQAPTAATAAAPQVHRLAAPLTSLSADGLSAAGVDVLHYYGDGRYLLSGPPPAHLLAPGFPKAAPAGRPRAAGISVGDISAHDVYPELHAAVAAGSPRRFDVEVVLAFPEAAAYLGEAFAKTAFAPLAPERPASRSVRGSLPAAHFAELLAHDYVLDIAGAMADAELLNDEARREHRVNVLHRGSPGLPGLDGAGVVVGVGDGGKLSGHPDLGDRILYSTNYYSSGWGIHPDFVAGLLGGSGAVEPRYRGSAPAAKFVIETSSSITYYAERYFRDYGMTLTNNSYGPYANCGTYGRYYYQAASLDQQGIDRPEVLHVFASGNSGRSDCDTTSAAPYGTVIPGGQTAKNTLTVGSAHARRLRFRGSSAGPTFDGRIKPEIVAVGTSVVSNNRSRDYNQGSGTSYAAPSVAGVLALLTQHYGRQHDGRVPSGALLKAIACNTATDIGRPGPDFEHGFGLVNAAQAARAISEAAHVSASLPIGQATVHEIDVPRGRERLKVMLYWHDRPGDTRNAGSALVDDLDLALVTPVGDTLRPWVLDALHPGQLPVRARDSLNNVEQVTLDAPAPGTYRLVVSSGRQPYGATAYALTWATLKPSVRITQPIGEATVDPTRPFAVAWEASPGQVGPWLVEVAPLAEGGRSGQRPAWSTVARDVPDPQRNVFWERPPGYGRFRFRVTSQATGLSDESAAAVTAISPPLALAAGEVCGGSAELSWARSEGAVAYEVYRFDGRGMVPVAKTADTTAFVSGITAETDGLYSVAAVDDHGKRGPRARGLFVADPGEKPCDAPVPVTWDAISVAGEDGGALLHWSVAAEFENDYFAVERGRAWSTGVTWTTLGEVPGRGTANAAAAYAFADAFPPPAETLYYRVRQVDFDGTTEMSPTVAFHVGDDASPAGETDAVVTLSQNRLSAATTVSLSPALGAATLELYDLAGRRLWTTAVTAGTTGLAVGADLPTGPYVLRATSGARASAHRVVKY